MSDLVGNPEDRFSHVAAQIVRDVSSFTDMSAKPNKFYGPSLIRSTSAKDFVICDKTNMIKIDKNGNCIAKFNQEDIKSVSYCALDPMDNIFLCDQIGGNIFLVPPDMSSKARVLIHGLTDISAVTYDDVKKQLIVCFQNNNSISIYQLSPELQVCSMIKF